MSETDVLLCVVVAQAAALAAIGLRWLLARREVMVTREDDYTDGRPRTFFKARLVSDGTPDGTYLADGKGLPVVFTGVRASQVQSRFRAGGRAAQVAVLLDGVRIDYGEKKP